MELIVITPENTIRQEQEIINQFFDTGLRRLHLRKPQYTKEQYRVYINGIKKEYHPRLVIHGCFELVDEFELGGIHLNSIVREQDLVKPLTERLSASFFSTSFHSWQELKDNKFEYKYVFISPVFNSISKKGYQAGIEPARAAEIRKELVVSGKYCPQIIGLGGVGVPQLKTLMEYGFDGAAMLGGIWLADDPVAVFCEAIQAAG
jgi:thiamine-phosphate pyrophosphorylase